MANMDNEEDEQQQQTAVNSALDDEYTQDTPTARPKHLYHGHRRASWTTDDIDELTELRARRTLLSYLAGALESRRRMTPFHAERTFEGAYQRTALGMAAYAIVVLKIFSPGFAKSVSYRSMPFNQV